MANDLAASLVLKLQDDLSGGLRKLQEQLEKLRGVTETIQMTGMGKAADQIEKINGQVARSTSLFARLKQAATGAMHDVSEAVTGAGRRLMEFGNRLGAIGGAVGGFAVLKPVEDYAERDKMLRSIAIMEHKSGPSLQPEIDRLAALVNQDALKHGVSSDSVAEAYKDLLGQGLPREAIDGIIGAHSAAAKAYGIPPDLLGPVTGALVGNLKIPSNEADAGAALAAIAQATQQGRFKIEDVSHALPGLSGVAASLGMTGRGSLNEIMAGLEISTKTATDATQAGVNFENLLSYITSNREDNLTRKKLGLDLPAILLKAEARGINPLDAFLAQIKSITAGKSPVAQAQAISGIVTNSEARKALLALVQHTDEFEKLRASLNGINAAKLKMDESSAMSGAQTPLDRLAENAHQLRITLGEGFAPVIRGLGSAVGYLNAALIWLNKNFPQTTHFVLGAIGGFLGLAAVMGTIAFVVPVVASGFGILGSVLSFLLSPAKLLYTALRFVVFLIASLTGISVGAVTAIAALATAFVAAAYDIYENWSAFRSFFATMWSGVKQTFTGFLEFVIGQFNGDFEGALSGLGHMGTGLAALFTGLWGMVKRVFLDFSSWVDSWSGGLASRVLSGIASGWGALIGGVHDLVGRLTSEFDNSKLGRLLGLATQKIASPAAAKDNGASAASVSPASLAPVNGRVDVHLRADPGTTVVSTQSSGAVNVQAPVAAPQRGATVGRP